MSECCCGNLLYSVLEIRGLSFESRIFGGGKLRFGPDIVNLNSDRTYFK